MEVLSIEALSYIQTVYFYLILPIKVILTVDVIQDWKIT
jgi:hypothetical protein